MNPIPRPAIAGLLLAATLAAVASSSLAQPNIGKLRLTTVPSGRAAARPVPQGGSSADEIRANLKRVKLPPGFHIELYALVPDARQLAVAPSGNLVVVGARTTTPWAVMPGRGGEGGVEVTPLAPGLGFKDANGACWTRDGMLVMAERNRVLLLPRAQTELAGPDVTFAEIVPGGGLVPRSEESAGHGARTCRVGPDGRLYITLGEPYNVQPREKVAMYRELGIGGIVRMNLDGTGREVYAVGIRNSVGLDFDPRDGVLWFTDNQTDGMGDDRPPGELNRAPKPGLDFGYPYWNGHVKVAGTAVAADLKDLPEPKDAVFPLVEFPAHQAQLGMVFYTGTMFPEHYRGGIFVASHGSWNSTVPTGALVDFVPLSGPDRPGPTEVFADNFRDSSDRYTGRPVDVAVLHDGSLLVSDDHAGALYRVTYQAP